MTPEEIGFDGLRSCIHFDRGSCTSCAKNAIRAAVLAEKQRCAKLAKDGESWGHGSDGWSVAGYIHDEILEQE